MPKISAATVAEHRAAQRSSLVRAGEDILSDAGLAGFSPGTVAERAGLARSSFYDYFATKDDLLVAIAINAMERWDAAMEAALRGVTPGAEQLRALVDATMSMTADRKHSIAGVIRDADLSPSRMEDLMALHDAVLRPVARVLEDLDTPASASPSVVALVHGVLGAGMQLVAHGVDHKHVAADVYQLLTRGVLAQDLS